MPNWCSNYIEISGESEGLEKIKILLENIQPEVDTTSTNVFRTLIGLQPDTDYEKDWYGGNVSWFGTKWDVDIESCNLDISDDLIVMSPETAWSPPIGFCEQLSKMYNVQVVITYEECGCDFAGRTTFFMDGTMEENDYSYSEGIYVLQNEYFWEKTYDDFEYLSETFMDENEIEVGGEVTDEMVKECITSEYSYVSEKDSQELTKVFTEYLVEERNLTIKQSGVPA